MSEDHASRPQDEVKGELSAFAREDFAPYKVSKLIELVDNLPLTPVGRVDKKVLRRSGWSTGREKLP